MAGRLIASDSTRLLRQALSARSRGFGEGVVNALAAQGYDAKEDELKGGPALRRAKGYAEAEAAKQTASENLQGRIAFADELKKRAGDENQPEGFDLRQFAEPRAAGLGISPAALTSFFARNKLAMNGSPPATAPTEVATKASNPLAASGIPLISEVPLKSQQEIDLENKKALAKKAQETTTPRYGGTYGSTGFYQ